MRRGRIRCGLSRRRFIIIVGGFGWFFVGVSVSSLPFFSVPADAPRVNYKSPGFLSKFLELQQVMWTTNQGLTDRHTFDSRPDSWPRLTRGIVCLSKTSHVHAYIHNPCRTFGSKTTSRSTSSVTLSYGGSARSPSSRTSSSEASSSSVRSGVVAILIAVRHYTSFPQSTPNISFF